MKSATEEGIELPSQISESGALLLSYSLVLFHNIRKEHEQYNA